MTKAVCINCGTARFGAFNKCPGCGYAVETNWEYAIGIIFSDQTITSASLDQLAASTSEKYWTDSDVLTDLSGNATSVIDGFFKGTGHRDMLELRRLAKNTFFSKQMNFHHVGPDGYTASVVVRGKDVTKELFDDFRKDNGDDAFFLDVYEKGVLSSYNIRRELFYAIKDVNLYIDRWRTPAAKRLSSIWQEGENYTRSYLKRTFGMEL